jgi:PAS domain S-box-containing protein
MSPPALSNLLRRYLAWRLLLPAVLLILGIGALLGWQRWLGIQREQHLQTLAISEYVATYLAFSAEIVNLLAETAPMSVFPALAAEYLRSTDSLERILLLTEQGEVLKTFPPLGLLKDYSRLISMRQRSPNTAALHISSPYLAPLSDQITVSLFSNVVDQRMVVGELNLLSLQNFIAGLGQMEAGSLIFVTDRYGTLVAHPDRTLVDQQTNLGSLRPVRLGLEGETGFLGIHPLDGLPYLFSTAPVRDGQWVVFTAWNARKQFFPVFTVLGALMLLLLLLLVTTVWMLKQNLDREVSRPLALFAQAMDRLERQDPEAMQTIPRSADLPFHELQVLRRGFLDMAQAIALREQALRLSEERFRTLADTLPESVFEADLSAKLTYANRNTLVRFGYTQAEMDSGLRLMDFAVQEEHNLIFDYTLKIFRDEQLPPLEFRAQSKVGETFPAQLHTSPIRIHDRACGLRGFIVDMTQTRQKQALRLEMERRFLHSQKLESLGVLAGGIAHDFNNLLMIIQGNLELAMAAIRDSTSPPYIHMAQAKEAVQRAANLTRQILAYSGKGHFMVQPIELNAFIRENSPMLQAVIAKGRTLTLDLCQKELWTMADPGQLQQVFINLTTNASEAMEEAQGTLTIRTGSRFCDADFLSQSQVMEKPRPGRFVYLVVEDTGCGIAPENRDRLFEPFFTTKAMGRGLGLAAVLGIVHGHGGALFVESPPGHGSLFQVLLPATPQNRPCSHRADA